MASTLISLPPSSESSPQLQSTPWLAEVSLSLHQTCWSSQVRVPTTLPNPQTSCRHILASLETVSQGTNPDSLRLDLQQITNRNRTNTSLVPSEYRREAFHGCCSLSWNIQGDDEEWYLQFITLQNSSSSGPNISIPPPSTPCPPTSHCVYRSHLEQKALVWQFICATPKKQKPEQNFF